MAGCSSGSKFLISQVYIQPVPASYSYMMLPFFEITRAREGERGRRWSNTEDIYACNARLLELAGQGKAGSAEKGLGIGLSVSAQPQIAKKPFRSCRKSRQFGRLRSYGPSTQHSSHPTEAEPYTDSVCRRSSKKQ